jgi:hypothetical protein
VHKPAQSAPPSRQDPIATGPNSRRLKLGRLGEELAAAHLTRLGFAVIARNARTRHGEIDLIVFDGQAIVLASR